MSVVKLNGLNSNASVRFVCTSQEPRPKSPYPWSISRGCCVRCLRPALRLPYLHVVSLSMSYEEGGLSRCCVTCLLFFVYFFGPKASSLPNQQGGWHVMIRSVMKIILSVSQRWSLALSCVMAPPPPLLLPAPTMHVRYARLMHECQVSRSATMAAVARFEECGNML